jgi:hypothetical protein
MPATESDRILAAGVTIPLAGGKSALLRYTLRSLKAFEDTFGSVGAALDALNGLYDGRNEKKIGTIVPALAAGLLHANIGEDALYDGLALHDRMPEYLAAVTEALDQAFPPAPAPGKDGEAEAAPASSGVASTTPPIASATTVNGSGA